jgi:hypothetical protein
MRPGRAFRGALGLFFVASLGLGCDSNSEKVVPEQPAAQTPATSTQQKTKAIKTPEQLKKQMPNL